MEEEKVANEALEKQFQGENLENAKKERLVKTVSNNDRQVWLKDFPKTAEDFKEMRR